MKLSEAIRLGSMMKPQGFWEYAYQAEFGAPATTCALGAAFDAIGELDYVMESDEEWDYAKFPVLAVQVSCCPQCGTHCAETVDSVVPHLNDSHEWTRERIADWVESIEQQQAQSEADALHARVLAGGCPI